jgi:hypothetical protein
MEDKDKRRGFDGVFYHEVMGLTSQNGTGRESLARKFIEEDIPGKAERDKLREEKQPNHDEEAIR